VLEGHEREEEITKGQKAPPIIAFYKEKGGWREAKT
jgi:hypothetical protein